MKKYLIILFTLLLLALAAPGWAAYPTILFNSATGSDTAASGAGPAVAITGTSATTYNVASTTITLRGGPHDLSGVLVDGSAAAWIDTASGRQFSKITGKNDTLDTVAVEDSFTITTSGLTFGIGGKRKTLDDADSRCLRTDVKGGWTISLDSGTYNLSSVWTSQVGGATTTGWITLKGNGGTPSVINCTTDYTYIYLNDVGYWKFENLKFTATIGGVLNNCGSLEFRTGPFLVKNCIFGDSTNKIQSGVLAYNPAWEAHAEIINCEFLYCKGPAVSNFTGAINSLTCRNCYFHNNTGAGIGGAGYNSYIENNIFYANGGDGITVSGSPGYRNNSVIAHNTIHGNTGDGIDLSAGAFSGIIENNNITANGNYGIRAHANQNNVTGQIDFNNFGTGATANTSGAMLNLTAGANDFAIDPGYADAANGNFLVTAAGLLGVGFPGTGYLGAGQSLTKSYVDIGASQRQHTMPAITTVTSGTSYNDGYLTGNVVLPADTTVTSATTYGSNRGTTGVYSTVTADKVTTGTLFGPNKSLTGTATGGGASTFINRLWPWRFGH